MKNILYIALTAAVLAGCSKENDMGGTSVENEVKITSGIASRASGTTWHSDDRVGVYMLADRDKNVLGDNVQYRNSAESGAAATFEAVTASQRLFYPITGAVDFLAYYPYQADIADYTYKVDVSDQSNLPAIDFMLAKIEGVARTTDAQNLTFRHRLSNVKLTIKAGDKLTAEDIENVAVLVTGTSPTADYNLSTGAITPGDAAPIAVPQVENPNNGTQRIAEAILIPQTNVSGVQFVLKVPGYGIFAAAIPGGETGFESGKQYEYTITVSRTDATITAENITDWGAGNDTGESGTADAISYSVGDYYPDPANPAIAIGVVFWLDDTDANYTNTGGVARGFKGKIVSLDEPPANWNDGTNEAGRLQWSTDDELKGATDDWNGDANMRTIKAIDTDFSNHPAFKWCVDKTTGGRTWYLPARNELKALFAAMSGLRLITSSAGVGEISDLDWGTGIMPNSGDYLNARIAFNTKFTEASGTEVDWRSFPYYWSSTEDNLGKVWYVSFGAGMSYKGDKVNNVDRVRAVSAF